jgi:hypothetical protein
VDNVYKEIKIEIILMSANDWIRSIGLKSTSHDNGNVAVPKG